MIITDKEELVRLKMIHDPLGTPIEYCKVNRIPFEMKTIKNHPVTWIDIENDWDPEKNHQSIFVLVQNDNDTYNSIYLLECDGISMKGFQNSILKYPVAYIGRVAQAINQFDKLRRLD